MLLNIETDDFLSEKDIWFLGIFSSDRIVWI